MAIHRSIRKAAHNAASALRGKRAGKPKGPRKGRGLPRGENAPGIDERLSAIAAEVLAGRHVEVAWELFRLQFFPGWEHERVAAALGLWSTRKGVKVTFEGRTVRGLPVIFVCFNV